MLLIQFGVSVGGGHCVNLKGYHIAVSHPLIWEFKVLLFETGYPFSETVQVSAKGGQVSFISLYIWEGGTKNYQLL